MGELFEKAVQVAVQAHGAQRRKYPDILYVTHPVAVMTKLVGYEFPETVLAAALTHDVLEDTDYGEKRLRSELGDTVADIVVSLTEDKSLPWEERKRRNAEIAEHASPEIKAVRTADVIHNLECILRGEVELGDALWERFSRGKGKKLAEEKRMLAALKNGWEHPLVEEYAELVERFSALM